MSDHSELKRLAESATPGPWAYDGSYVCPSRTEDGTTYVELWRSIADCHQPENTKFIAAANPAAVLALIAEVEHLSIREDVLENLCDARFRINLDLETERDRLKAEVGRLKAGVNSDMEEIERIQSEYDKQFRKARDLRAERDNLKTEVEGLRAQHGRDSAELRSLCQARDDARKERDQLKAEVERLTADNASLRGSCAKLGVEHAGMVRIHRKANTEIRRLSAEVEALRKLAPSKEIIWCACGDGYPVNSYGAGFMDANNGVCANCDAAMSNGEQP